MKGYLIFQNLNHLILLFHIQMYLRNMKNYQSMNVVFTDTNTHELWLGDYYSATNYELLKQKNITTVLTAAAMLGVKYPKQLNITHKTINAFDIPTYKMTPHFDEVNKFIKEGLERGNVLVHCAAGISRSTTCVLVYLMRNKGYSFKSGLQMVKGKRHVANPNYGFQDQLAKYQIALRKMKKREDKKEQKIEIKKEKVEEEEKKIVLEFINEQENMNKSAINSRYPQKASLSIYGDKINRKNESMKKTYNQETGGLKRGQSLNNRNTMGSTVSNNSGEKVHQQFLTFKLQQPKIVTIKK